MEQPKTFRFNGYNAYLIYKEIIDIITEKPSTAIDIAKKMGIESETIYHCIRQLVSNKVISRTSYDKDTTGRKRAVYKLIKDE